MRLLRNNLLQRALDAISPMYAAQNEAISELLRSVGCQPPLELHFGIALISPAPDTNGLNHFACLLIGRLYALMGHHEEAVSWVHVAAVNGHAMAEAYLGLCYYTGIFLFVSYQHQSYFLLSKILEVHGHRQWR